MSICARCLGRSRAVSTHSAQCKAFPSSRRTPAIVSIYIGGKPRNLQKHQRRPSRGRGTDKPMIFAAIERGRHARAAVVNSASAIALDPLMHRWFDYVAEHTFRRNTAHDAPERIARCLIGQHGRLRLQELLA